MLKRLLPIMLSAIFASCISNSNEPAGNDGATARRGGTALTVPAKEVLAGTIGVCSASDNLELIKPDSGIVNIVIGNDRFFGATDPGDSVEVTLLMIDGHPVSSTIVNLNTLLHTWENRNDSIKVNTFLSIQENHYAHYFNNVGMDRNGNWYLDDGLLILVFANDSTKATTNDTLAILSLNADTLVVYGDNEVRTFVK